VLAPDAMAFVTDYTHTQPFNGPLSGEPVPEQTFTHYYYTTTILWLSGLCPGQPGAASTRRYISGFSGAK